VRTESLVVDSVPSYLNFIPINGATHSTGEVLDRELRLCRDTGNGGVILTPFGTGTSRGRAGDRGDPLKEVSTRKL
jgi:hypothetical protein